MPTEYACGLVIPLFEDEGVVTAAGEEGPIVPALACGGVNFHFQSIIPIDAPFEKTTLHCQSMHLFKRLPSTASHPF